tara:strand:+ start:61 stop:222 length:162 start_codon:yes stop_codon:yes gene_type:complete
MSFNIEIERIQKGNKIKERADITIFIPSDDTQRIQEGHILCGHILCEMVEKSL